MRLAVAVVAALTTAHGTLLQGSRETHTVIHFPDLSGGSAGDARDEAVPMLRGGRFGLTVVPEMSGPLLPIAYSVRPLQVVDATGVDDHAASLRPGASRQPRVHTAPGRPAKMSDIASRALRASAPAKPAPHLPSLTGAGAALGLSRFSGSVTGRGSSGSVSLADDLSTALVPYTAPPKPARSASGSLALSSPVAGQSGAVVLYDSKGAEERVAAAASGSMEPFEPRFAATHGLDRSGAIIEEIQ